MCDFSLHSVTSRPAKVGDKLTTHDFGTGTRGFAASEDQEVAVCLLPGTELAFTKPVEYGPAILFSWRWHRLDQRTAIFRQINKERPSVHHDALEFPEGQIVLLTRLVQGQEAIVLQLPVQAATPLEAERHERVAHAI